MASNDPKQLKSPDKSHDGGNDGSLFLLKGKKTEKRNSGKTSVRTKHIVP